MKYRTDLALECKEILEQNDEYISEDDGVLIDKAEYEEGVSIVKIQITNEKGEQLLEKPTGTYTTIEAEGILDENDNAKKIAEEVFIKELSEIVPFNSRLKVLAVGLGNSDVTPDALGPSTISKVRPTRHLFEMFGADSDDEVSNVSCIIPGVTGNTGLESAEVVKKAAEMVQPDVIIVVDSLAARDMSRLSTTIQLTDTGISPGAGMGNNRTGINEQNMGVKVIAIGVPTVIDVTTIVRDSLMDNVEDVTLIEEYLDKFKLESIVTSTDIDSIIKEFSDIISNGINKVLHPGIYS